MPADDKQDRQVIAYARCTVIDADGRAREGSVNAVRMMTVAEAVAALRRGERAWVAVGDGDQVLASWHNYGRRGGEYGE